LKASRPRILRIAGLKLAKFMFVNVEF